jgi:hypothetical protein
MKLLNHALLIVLVACANTQNSSPKRTTYGPFSNAREGGYIDYDNSDNNFDSVFVGNIYTGQRDASFYAGLRAHELCFELGFKAAQVNNVENLTKQKAIQRSSFHTSTSPIFTNGQMNTGLGGGIAFNANTVGGGQTTSQSSWVETYTYPTFKVSYTCLNNFYVAVLDTEDLDKQETNHFVKDLLGAVQVTGVPKDSPNREVFEVGDIITHVNSKRVFNRASLLSAFESNGVKKKARVNIIRSGANKSLNVILKDYISMFEEDKRVILKNTCHIEEIKNRPICKSN